MNIRHRLATLERKLRQHSGWISRRTRRKGLLGHRYVKLLEDVNRCLLSIEAAFEVERRYTRQTQLAGVPKEVPQDADHARDSSEGAPGQTAEAEARSVHPD